MSHHAKYLNARLFGALLRQPNSSVNGASLIRSGISVNHILLKFEDV
jgi:hypothetical protein